MVTAFVFRFIGDFLISAYIFPTPPVTKGRLWVSDWNGGASLNTQKKDNNNNGSRGMSSAKDKIICYCCACVVKKRKSRSDPFPNKLSFVRLLVRKELLRVGDRVSR